jgi:hypothetical protein
MKTRIDNPKPPIQLYSKKGGGSGDPKPEDVFLANQLFGCGECNHIYSNHQMAADCCRQFYCSCGKKLEAYQLVNCHSCASVLRNSKLEVMEYKGGPVHLVEGDEVDFWETMEDMVEHFRDNNKELPDFVHECDQDPYPGLDIESAIDNSVEDLFENAREHLVDEDELIKFVEKWNAKQNFKTWNPRYEEKVLVKVS